jgi:2,6-dihydroxypseudooxynicotine hydrolase
MRQLFFHIVPKLLRITRQRKLRFRVVHHDQVAHSRRRRAAAYEPRLACAVAIGGPYDFAAEFDNVPELTRQAFTVRSHSPDVETARARAQKLTLKDAARRIERPFLVVFGKEDRLIPYQQAERLYAEIPARDKRLQMYPDGNHVCNNMPFAYRPLVRDWIAAYIAQR